jgi:aldehyde:ferredoxin oxidoreductase
MSIRMRVERLLSRMKSEPQFQRQGVVLFVDLERRETRSGYLPIEITRNFLGGRGINMVLLYNLMEDGRDALDPEIPLIFGSGPFVGYVPGGTRANFSSISPDSHCLMDANGGDYFPSWCRRLGYDHIVLYGRSPEWTLLRITQDEVGFYDAKPYLGLDNLDTAAAIERDFNCKERKDMALARITTAGENLVLSAGIMGGIKATWARGGGGAKMGSLRLKAIMAHGKLAEAKVSEDNKALNKEFMDQVLSTSVIKNALRKVGTPFLYKACRVLGALGVKNNQETGWVDTLDADNFDVYRPGMDGCLKCPVRCRAGNDMTPEGKGGWGADALKGLKGNASYDHSQANIEHKRQKTWKGVKGDGVYDRYDHGDGPEFVSLGKFGPNIGITEPEQVLRLNNIVNDLGLDASSAGGALGWAMELYQRGLIDKNTTGGLDLSWGNYPVIEKLLFMTAKREGFGDVLADSARAVEKGKYPPEALKYLMTSKGLFQSDPHDPRVLKAFALGLAVSTRGLDHLRNRPTLEINAHINDNPALKTSLYGAVVSPQPTSYEGKEYTVRKCEDTFAAGDALGMCRFQTKLFNSPSLPGFEQFSKLLAAVTGIEMTPEEIEQAGRNIIGLERLINARLGITAADDTLPRRWFEEPNTAGPFKGEKIDREKFEIMKSRFYAISGLTSAGVPKPEWHAALARIATGFAVRVVMPSSTGNGCGGEIVIDEPVSTAAELRAALRKRIACAAGAEDDSFYNLAVNGEVLLSGEGDRPIRSGDEVTLVPVMAGG